MKIEVLKILENALIGGRSGDNAFIYNNEFIYNLYSEWCNKSKKYDFKDFLLDCISDTEVKEEIKQIHTETIVKNIKVDEGSSEYKEYIKAQNELNEARNKLNNKLKELATKTSPELEQISYYEVEYGNYDTSIKYKISPILIRDKEY